MPTMVNNKDSILKKYYKSISGDLFAKEPKENEILKRYRSIQKQREPSELILDIAYDKKKITFISGDFKKITLSFKSIPGWRELDETDKYNITLSWTEIYFGNEKLEIPFDYILYNHDRAYRTKTDKKHEPYRKKIAKRIKLLRLRYGKKQSDIRGLSERQISRIENGHIWTNYKTEKKIATALGMSYKKFREEIYTDE